MQVARATIICRRKSCGSISRSTCARARRAVDRFVNCRQQLCNGNVVLRIGIERARNRADRSVYNIFCMHSTHADTAGTRERSTRDACELEHLSSARSKSLQSVFNVRIAKYDNVLVLYLLLIGTLAGDRWQNQRLPGRVLRGYVKTVFESITRIKFPKFSDIFFSEIRNHAGKLTEYPNPMTRTPRL